MISILQAAGYSLTKSATQFPSPSVGLQNWSGIPGSTCVSRFSAHDGGQGAGPHRHQAHHLHRISSAKSFDLPLLNVRFANHRKQAKTHKALSLLEITGRTTTHLLRVSVDIEVCFRIQVLYLVNSWLQFSVLEDGTGASCRGQGHGWESEHDSVGNMSNSKCWYL